MTRTPWPTLLVCLLLLCSGCSKKEEASHQGKSLSEWLTMLEEQDPAKRYAAIRAVGEIGPEAKEAIPALIQTIRETRNRNKRFLVASVHALLGMGREVVPHMITLLKDDDWEIRRGAAWMLGKLGPEAEDAVPALTEALRDSNAVVRAKASEALKRIKGEETTSTRPSSGPGAPGRTEG